MSRELTIGGTNIEDMDKASLRELLTLKEVKFYAQDTNEQLRERIYGSGLFTTVAPKEGGVQTDKETGKKTHKVFGEYIHCIVHPQSEMNKNGDIFVGINQHHFMFKPRTPIWLPKGIIQFLRKECVEAEHYYDKHAVSENGNIGAHLTRYNPKYVVEILIDED
jgi:hypothetical protein